MEQYITTHAELAAAIRELYIGSDRMEVDPDRIAQKLFRECTFGRSLRGRGGKVTLAGLRMAVALFFESEFGMLENSDDSDSPDYLGIKEYAQRLLDSVRALAEAEFTPEDYKSLHPLDRPRFRRRFQNDGKRALALLEAFHALTQREHAAANEAKAGQ